MDNSIEPMNRLIDVLDDIAQSTPRGIFSKGRISIDPEQLSDLATQMRFSLPIDMRQAASVVAEKNKILDEARAEAERIIAEAERKRRELLDQSSIIRDAQMKANEVINEANDNANMIRVSVLDFCKRMLDGMDQNMMRNLSEVKILRKEFDRDNASVESELRRYASGNPQQASAQMPEGADEN